MHLGIYVHVYYIYTIYIYTHCIKYSYTHTICIYTLLCIYYKIWHEENFIGVTRIFLKEQWTACLPKDQSIQPSTVSALSKASVMKALAIIPCHSMDAIIPWSYYSMHDSLLLLLFPPFPLPIFLPDAAIHSTTLNSNGYAMVLMWGSVLTHSEGPSWQLMRFCEHPYCSVLTAEQMCAN